MNPASLSWRLLDAAALTRVYKEEMCRDFPVHERKPLSMILSTLAEGAAHCWGVYDGETLAAYLLMAGRPGELCLLDYFAVLPAYRASGLGGRLLAALPAHETQARAILIESEVPEKADDPEMARRRLGFYARAGAVDTGWVENLYQAWFRLLTLPCPGGEPLPPDEAAAQIIGYYRGLIPPAAWEAKVRFWRPDGSLHIC